MPAPVSVPIQGRFRADQIKQIDEWRRSQPDLPTRGSAVRRLTCIALRAEGAQREDERASA
jgi:hypothetical protein